MRGIEEFRESWRPLAACFIGMGAALSLNPYILSTFAPYLIESFGWTRSQWALMSIPQMLVIICIPVAGRMADKFGVKRVAAVGAISFPLFCVAIAMMNGDIGIYLAIYVAQTILGATTTATVYTRLVAGAFSLRRGLALAICGSSPALIAVVGSPLITAFIESHGWRAGYLVVAGFSAIASLTALALIPARPKQSEAAALAGAAPATAATEGVYRKIAAMPIFWMMLVGCFLVNLPHALATSQLKMVVLEQGVSAIEAGVLVSIFAIGVTIGRFASGMALDYFPAHWVAGIGLGLPLPGLLLLASSFDTMPSVAAAIMLIGLSFGSEGDVIAFLVVRYFGIEVFSTVLGLLTAAMGGAMAAGAVVLGISLEMTDSFNPYLLLASGSVAIGSVLFMMLGNGRYRPVAA